MIHLFPKHHNSVSFTDEEIRIAAVKVRDAMLQSLDKDLGPHHIFSESFQIRMKALFHVDERRIRTRRALQHVAVFLIGVFLTGALLLAFNPSARADFSRWIKSTYEKSFFYDFFSRKSDETVDLKTDLLDVEFSWLPSDFSIEELYSDPYKKTLLLSNDTESIILNYWIENDIDHIEVFSVDYTQETVEIHGNEADFYCSVEEDKDNVLIWVDEDARIVYNLFSKRSKEIMIKIAEGIN